MKTILTAAALLAGTSTVLAADILPLNVGESVSATIAGKQVQHYSVSLQSGEALEAEFMQTGVDVVVDATAPDGSNILSYDRGGVGETETFRFTALMGGTYNLAVRAFEPAAESGAYTAKIAAIVPADKNAENIARGLYPVPELFELWKAARTDKNAVKDFIKRRDGKPLVHPVEGQPDERDVTFYLAADSDTNYVMYSGGPDFGGLVMQPLGGTELRFVTLRVNADARYRYNFTQYKFLKAGRKGQTEVRKQVRTDDAILELDQAPAQPYISAKPGTPKGTVETLMLPSKKMGGEREIKVYRPAGNVPASKLLILFDGESYSTAPDAAGRSAPWVPGPTILDNLIEAGETAPIVAVFVSSGRTRNQDMPSDAFGDFVARELVPWARQTYPIAEGAENVILAGSSRGGYAAALIAHRYADVIGNVLSLSGSFWINDKTVQAERDRVPFHFSRLAYPQGEGKITQLYKTSARLPVRFYMTIGRYDLATAMVGSNRQLRDILQAKGYDVTYSEFSGGHDYLSWRGQLADGLKTLAKP